MLWGTAGLTVWGFLEGKPAEFREEEGKCAKYDRARSVVIFCIGMETAGGAVLSGGLEAEG